MQATIHKTLDEIRALESSWGRLTPMSPFSSWDFAYDWLRCAPSVQPYVIAVHSQGKLIGVAPWCVTPDYAKSRVLTGVGAESAWYHDPLVADPESAPEVFRAIARALRPRKWDAIDLTLQAEPCHALLDDLKPLGLTVAQRPSDRQSRIIALDADWETSWKRFPSAYRKGVRRLSRHLELRPHAFGVAEGDQAQGWLETLIRLNHARWQTGSNWDLTYAAMRANTPTLLARGELRLFGLSIEGRMAALTYHVRKGKRSFMLMGNFHPDFADYSPANLLLHWSIQRLHQEGVREVDMGPGEYDWKKRLQSGLVETVHTRVGGSLKGMALVGWRGMLKPRLSSAT